MSHSYWKNLLSQPSEDSEYLNDYHQLSSKIDDYYKTCSSEHPESSIIQVHRHPEKSLTTAVRGGSVTRSSTRKQSFTPSKKPSAATKQLKDSFHRRTFTMKENSNVPRNSYPYTRNTSTKSSKKQIFDIV